MSFGHGCPISLSTKQRINTRSSTEAELVGVNDAMAIILWTRSFLRAQGYDVTDNVVYQDNQSAMLLEKNGRRSSGKKTRHIEIRYYFITDNINRGTVRVTHCPTLQMVADFFTKPLQGALFRKFRDMILGYIPIQWPEPKECVGTHDSSSDISPGEESREPVIRSEPLKQIIPRTRISYVDAVKKTSQASRTQ